MDISDMKARIEALIFVSPEPLSIADIKKHLEASEHDDKAEVEAMASDDAEPVEAPAVDVSEDQFLALEVAPLENISSEVIDATSLDVVTEEVVENNETQQEVVAQNSDEVVMATEESTEQDPLAQLKAAQKELNEEISKADIKNCLDELIVLYQGQEHGFELVNVAKGYQFRTKNKMASIVRKIYKLPKPRLSAPSMETLAIVAYQQPITRNKIDDIRGVDTGGVLKTLLDKDLVKIVGRSEEPGRPIMYGTSKAFLETFSLASLAELPTLKDLETINATLSKASAAPDEEVSEGNVETFAEELSFDNTLDLESNELLGDLDESLNSLKSLESAIFTETAAESADTKPEEAQPT